MCQRTRAKQEGVVAVGDTTVGRVHHAFEDAGDSRGIGRGGDKNGGARECMLADVRQSCRKRQHVSRSRIEIERQRRCGEMRCNNQLLQTKRGG